MLDARRFQNRYEFVGQDFGGWFWWGTNFGTFNLRSSDYIASDCIEKQMIAHCFLHYYSQRCQQMVPNVAGVTNTSLTQTTNGHSKANTKPVQSQCKARVFKGQVVGAYRLMHVFVAR